ncbi:MAG: glycosyltransferase [Thermodesulfobacteriota bacterium]|nr:glycosyltransferase [Thermodesulfobacteriota bacterium]
MKTILHLGKYDFDASDAGGVERVIKNCAQALKTDFHQVLAFFSKSDVRVRVENVLDYGNGQGKKGLSRGSEDHSGCLTKVLFPVHCVAGYAPVNFFMSVYLKQLIRETAPDIIHAHMPGLMPFFCLKALKTRKTIVHWHADVQDTRVAETWLYPFYKVMEQQLLQAADVIIVTSPQYLDSSRSLKQHKKKCVVIPLGIDSAAEKINSQNKLSRNHGMDNDANPVGHAKDNFVRNTEENPVRNTEENKRENPDGNTERELEKLEGIIENFIKNKNLILSVGRLTYYKGYVFLIRAMKQFKMPDTVLVIAGDGPEKADLLREIKTNHLESQVLLPGRISENDKNMLLARANAFCLPSIDRAEAFGLSLVEAMDFKLPLITANVRGSGMNYVNIHNKTGLKVPPGNSPALASAIDRLLRNPKLSEKFGRNANQRFRENFQSRITAEKIKALYMKAISRQYSANS